jgi:Co/Zn/Cd efflux system component
MTKSTYKISKMDCASEETLIRMKLEPIADIIKLDFDLHERSLSVYHKGDVKIITKSLSELNLNSIFIKSDDSIADAEFVQTEINRKYLIQVLLINFTFFIVEILAGFISNSMGLVGDSLDMLTDAFVYGMSLLVVGKSLIYKKKVAALSGFSQLALALLGYFEVMRRFIGLEKIPDYFLMIVISIFALAANVLSLYILQKSKSKEVHMKATMICTSNDIIVNAGVILAGVLVLLLSSPIPDLVIGLIIFTMVLQGSVRILKLTKN